MNSQNKTIIILHEKVLESIIKDIVTFLMFAGLMYFNHKVLSGATVIDVLFIFLVIISIRSKGDPRVFYVTPQEQETMKYLKEKYNG